MKKIFSSKSLFTFYFLLFTFYLNAQPGSLDPSFGSKGQAVFSPANFVAGITLGHYTQKNGKIIQLAPSGDFINLIRYNEDGSIDEIFGEKGIVQNSYTDLGYSSLELAGINVQADDKILVVGHYNHSPGYYYKRSSALMRFNADGTPDKSFGENGLVSTLSFTDGFLSTLLMLNAIALDREGRIIVGGSFDGDISNYRFLIRYLPSGITDNSFGETGIIYLPFFIDDNGTGSTFRVQDILFQKNEKILVGGSSSNFETGNKFATVCLLPNGSIDSGFGTNGFILTKINNNRFGDIVALGLQSDGKIIGAGDTKRSDFAKTDMALVRYTTDGKLDESFGEKGISVTHIADGYYSEVKDIAIQSNDKIVTTFWFSKIEQGTEYFQLYRYTANGITDSGFGENGRVVTDFTSFTGYKGYCTDISIRKDGKILASGGGGTNFYLARYYSDKATVFITKIKTWIRHHILNFTDTNPNTAYYAIEQQKSGGGFTEIATIDASKKEKLKSENEYSFALPTTSNEITSNETTRNEKRETVYRIKSVNKDGSFVYSNLVADNYQLSIINYQLSPNPATNTLNISGLSSIVSYQLSIVNKEGIQQSSFKISSSTNYKINISSLQTGIYFIKIKDGNGVVSSLKFIKE